MKHNYKKKVSLDSLDERGPSFMSEGKIYIGIKLSDPAYVFE